jgi:hypothetical protein
METATNATSVERQPEFVYLVQETAEHPDFDEAIGTCLTTHICINEGIALKHMWADLRQREAEYNEQLRADGADESEFIKFVPRKIETHEAEAGLHHSYRCDAILTTVNVWQVLLEEV